MGESSTGPPAFGIRDGSSYGWGVFHERHPALVRQLCESLPYGPPQRAALHSLLDESRHGTVAEPDEDDPERRSWLRWGEPYFGGPWKDVPFLWAESYFYRRLLAAVGFFTPGPWRDVDPFAPLKAAELRDPALEPSLAWVNGLAEANPRDAFDAALLASLHGNRADLTFRFGNSEGKLPEELHHELVSDHTDQVWNHLNGSAPLPVTIVLDNAGRELLADLVLADHLLARNLAESVTLHTKPVPYYVSDATTDDVRDCLIRLTAMPGEAGRAGQRLHRAAAEGRLRVDTHSFYCAPLGFDQIPDDLARRLRETGLTIYKGDLNYRRLVGDRAWDPATPFASVTEHLPGPTVALRTLKSTVAVGLHSNAVRQLDDTDPTWRINGTRALVQARL